MEFVIDDCQGPDYLPPECEPDQALEEVAYLLQDDARVQYKRVKTTDIDSPGLDVLPDIGHAADGPILDVVGPAECVERVAELISTEHPGGVMVIGPVVGERQDLIALPMSYRGFFLSEVLDFIHQVIKAPRFPVPGGPPQRCCPKRWINSFSSRRSQ